MRHRAASGRGSRSHRPAAPRTAASASASPGATGPLPPAAKMAAASRPGSRWPPRASAGPPPRCRGRAVGGESRDGSVRTDGGRQGRPGRAGRGGPSERASQPAAGGWRSRTVGGRRGRGSRGGAAGLRRGGGG